MASLRHRYLMSISRRKFLVGLGTAAVGAAGILGAYEISKSLLRQQEISTSTVTETGSKPGQAVQFNVETWLANLTIPWELVFAPDDRAFFTERTGRLSVVKLGEQNPSVFAEVPVEPVGEGGLLGLALSPEFDSDHFVYVYHTYRSGPDIQNRVVRYRDENGQGTNPEVILDGIPGASIHDGGRIRFGPDGKLYITTGDSGRGQLAQDLSSLAGKVLRLEADGSVPADNPIPQSPVFSYGHRNPQGIDWNPQNERMYETEHGPSGEGGRSANDEVNLIEPGKNYGWPLVVGTSNDPNFVNPLFYTGNNETWAPSGCSFYRGNQFPTWKNNFFIGTLRGTHLHRFLFDPQTSRILESEKLLEGTLGRLRDVVEGPDGLLYILTSNRDGRGSPAANDDRILRLVPT